MLYHSPAAFRRLHLTMREIYFSGVLSLVVIMVSGLFVGMVLGLQGYDALNKYGAGDSLGIFVGLSLVRELGPVVAGAAVREPRRQRGDRRDRSHEDDGAAVGDGNDGGRSAGAHRRAALLGRRHLHAAACRAVLA